MKDHHLQTPEGGRLFREPTDQTQRVRELLSPYPSSFLACHEQLDENLPLVGLAESWRPRPIPWKAIGRGTASQGPIVPETSTPSRRPYPRGVGFLVRVFGFFLPSGIFKQNVKCGGSAAQDS